MSNKGLLERFAYYALLIVGVVFIINSIINSVGVDIKFVNTLINFAREIATLLMVVVVAFVGWSYAKSQGFLWKVIFFVAAVLVIASSVMNIIS